MRIGVWWRNLLENHKEAGSIILRRVSVVHYYVWWQCWTCRCCYRLYLLTCLFQNVCILFTPKLWDVIWQIMTDKNLWNEYCSFHDFYVLFEIPYKVKCSVCAVKGGLYENLSRISEFSRCLYINRCSVCAVNGGLYENLSRISQFSRCLYINKCSVCAVKGGLYENLNRISQFFRCLYINRCSVCAVEGGLYENLSRISQFSRCLL
jgi:hypothetical protein